MPGKGRPFEKGHKGGGDPHAGQRQKYRARIFACSTVEDFDAVAKRLIALAKGGEQWAVKEYFDRILGKETQGIDGDFTIDDRTHAEAELRERLQAIAAVVLPGLSSGGSMAAGTGPEPAQD